jgi:hypothetical protein
VPLSGARSDQDEHWPRQLQQGRARTQGAGSKANHEHTADDSAWKGLQEISSVLGVAGVPEGANVIKDRGTQSCQSGRL